MTFESKKGQVFFHALKNYSLQQFDLNTKANVSAPFNIYIEVNDYCNLKCQYCDIWKNKTVNHLDTEQWMRILTDIAGFVKYPKINFSGGEPLIRKDIFQLLSYCVEQGMLTGVVSNGTTLPAHTEKLASIGLSNINISLDSLDERFDEVRGKQGLHRELAISIRNLKSAIDRSGSGTKIILKSVLSKANSDSLDSLFAFCEDVGLYGVSLQPIERNFGSEKQSIVDSLRPDRSQAHHIIDRLMASKPHKLMNTHAEMQGWKNYFSFGKQLPPDVEAGRTCSVGYSNAFIDARGNLRTCWEYPAVMNLTENEFPEAWRGAHGQRQRQKKCRTNCTINCQRSISAFSKFRVLKELMR